LFACGFLLSLAPVAWRNHRVSGECVLVIEGEERKLIQSIVDFGDTLVREVMTPRPDIVAVPEQATIGELRALFREQEYSRIPVYDPQRGPEHIVGVLYAKDLMRWTRFRLTLSSSPASAMRISTMKIGQIMHNVLVVPETKSLLELLGEFQVRKRHLAVVVDEFGSTAGVITVEDVLEQLVGELEDEFDVASGQPAVTDANAPATANAAQTDTDGDAIGEISSRCPWPIGTVRPAAMPNAAPNATSLR
jgi:CBS domain containing-hemolysin-like protein